MEKKIIFPLRLTDEMHELITKAAFVTGKSKHQYCIDAIRKVVEKDAEGVQISRIPKQGSPTKD
jgi:uncharacterized protein (DUF1778 family)